MVALVKVAAFHSKLPGTKYHHNNDACLDATNVAVQNRVPGTGDLPLCEHCAELAAWRRIARRRKSQ
jgi:hypothetical protein